LAAERDGHLVLYDVLFDPGALYGHEVLDIGGKVREIGVQQPYEGELGRITDPEQVKRFVDLVVQAPVGGATQEAGERIYILDFHLHDGTMISRPYNWDANLVGGTMPPPVLRGITPHLHFKPNLRRPSRAL
jgi:hypothetical protein